MAQQIAPAGTQASSGGSGSTGGSNPADSADQFPKTSDYTEAFSAIDEIEGSDGGGGEPSVEPSEPTPKPKPSREPKEKTESKEKPDPNPDSKPTPKPKSASRRPVGEDLDGLMDDKKEEPKDDSKESIDSNPEEPDFDSPQTPKKLRDTYKRTREELEKTSARVRELEESGQRSTKEAVEKVSKEYDARIADLERRRSELETQIRFSDYERSEDFQTKFHTPLREAWKETMQNIEGMTVPDGNGGEREVTPQDIVGLMGMTNAAARAAANAMFGTAAPEIMSARAKLMGLQTARTKALEEWRQKGSEAAAAQQKQREDTRKYWEGEVEGYQAEHPELFGASETDAEGRLLVKKGTALARKAFLGDGIPEGLTPEQRRQELLSAQSLLAARGAAFPRMYRDLQKANSRVKELEKQLAELSETEIETGGRRRGESGGGSGGEGGAPEDAIDAIPGM